jgi:hypothetical protein
MSRFAEGSKVQHVNGGVYRILRVPDDRRLEHSGEPFYEYERIADGQVWLRCQSEMEDGRFVVLPSATGEPT